MNTVSKFTSARISDLVASYDCHCYDCGCCSEIRDSGSYRLYDTGCRLGYAPASEHFSDYFCHRPEFDYTLSAEGHLLFRRHMSFNNTEFSRVVHPTKFERHISSCLKDFPPRTICVVNSWRQRYHGSTRYFFIRYGYYFLV